MARCFIVVGPEDSGNRMMHNILLKAGCDGDGGYSIPYRQRFDDGLPEPVRDISWIRSVPHEGSMPLLSEMTQEAAGLGYSVMWIIMVRSPWIVQRASVQNHTGSEIISKIQLAEAYPWIFQEMFDAHKSCGIIEHILVPYGELVREPRALRELLRILDLSDVEFEFINGNNKWYPRNRQGST